MICITESEIVSNSFSLRKIKFSLVPPDIVMRKYDLKTRHETELLFQENSEQNSYFNKIQETFDFPYRLNVWAKWLFCFFTTSSLSLHLVLLPSKLTLVWNFWLSRKGKRDTSLVVCKELFWEQVQTGSWNQEWKSPSSPEGRNEDFFTATIFLVSFALLLSLSLPVSVFFFLSLSHYSL